MDRKTLSFIALALSMLFGVGFVVIPESNRTAYAVVGGVIVALAWVAVGMFGRDGASRDRDRHHG